MPREIQTANLAELLPGAKKIYHLSQAILDEAYAAGGATPPTFAVTEEGKPVTSDVILAQTKQILQTTEELLAQTKSLQPSLGTRRKSYSP